MEEKELLNKEVEETTELNEEELNHVAGGVFPETQPGGMVIM